MAVLRLLIAPLKFKRRKIDEPNEIYTQQLSTVLTVSLLKSARAVAEL